MNGPDSRPMRIMLLGPANSIHLQRWAAALHARGHAVCVVSEHPCEPHLLPAGVERLWMPHGRGLGYVTNAWSLRRHVARWRADLVNVHYATGYGTMAALSGVAPTLLSVWGTDVYVFPYLSRLHAALLRWNLRRAEALASTSRAMADQVRRLVPERQEVAITPFGVDVAVFHPGEGAAPAGRVTIGMVKSLASTYGVDLLLKAFAGLRKDPAVTIDSQLWIVGDGPQEAEFKALAADLGIAEATRFVGAVPHEEVPSWLRRFDIYAAPSRTESFGVAVIEASACGIPVVVSDAGGLPEVVRHGESGRVVPSEDIPALQRALTELVLDAGLRRLLGAQGRAFVAREYDWPACVDRMEACYRRLLSDAGAASARDA